MLWLKLYTAYSFIDSKYNSSFDDKIYCDLIPFRQAVLLSLPTQRTDFINCFINNFIYWLEDSQVIMQSGKSNNRIYCISYMYMTIGQFIEIVQRPTQSIFISMGIHIHGNKYIFVYMYKRNTFIYLSVREICMSRLIDNDLSLGMCPHMWIMIESRTILANRPYVKSIINSQMFWNFKISFVMDFRCSCVVDMKRTLFSATFLMDICKVWLGL